MAGAAVYGDSSPTADKDKTDDPYDDPTFSTDEDNACLEPEGADPEEKNAMTLPSNSLDAPPLGAFKDELAKAAVTVHDMSTLH